MGNSLRHGQKTSKSGQDAAKKKAARMAKTQAVANAKNRQNLTGRVRQGNHDSLTKKIKKGQDSHMVGVTQNGPAGKKKP